MSDYSKTTNFSAKDSLSTGDPDKLIKGSLFDTEFDNLATASATKFDSDDIASLAEAQAQSSNVVLMTPLRTANWSDANGGMVGDIQALADPGADTLLGWDDSASAAIGFTAGAGIVFSTTSLTVDHDAATNFVANEHINHTAVSIATAANSGLTGGGTIAATRSLVFSIAALAEFGLTDNFAATDEFAVNDGGTSKRVDYQHMGIRVVDIDASRTLVLADVNSMVVAAHASVAIVLTIAAEATTDMPIGCFFHIMRNGAAEVDVAVTTDTFTAVLGKSPRANGSVATVMKIASATWVMFGDTKV